jgi:magnesium transporter
VSHSKSRYSQHLSERAQKAGLPPGSLVYLGKKSGEQPSRISMMSFSGDYFDEQQVDSPEVLPLLLSPPTTTWINVDGIHREGWLAAFGQRFQLNSLLMEDILNTDHRPKQEEADTCIYIILKIFDFNPQTQELLSEQVSIVLGDHLLITFMEEEANEFEPLRQRIRNGSQRLRNGGAGYLAYAVLDIVVDSYFNALEKMGTCLEDIEEHILTQTSGDSLQQVHHIKRELIFLRKHIWPVRELLASLQHSDSPLLPATIQPYLRDIHDHIIQIIDTLETYRDLLGGIQDLYHAIQGNRMNEIMKVLTIISTLFIPLTFIVGVYGMNFEFMPELHTRWGYPLAWLVMILIAVAMLLFFKRRKWL